MKKWKCEYVIYGYGGNKRKRRLEIVKINTECLCHHVPGVVLSGHQFTESFQQSYVADAVIIIPYYGRGD